MHNIFSISTSFFLQSLKSMQGVFLGGRGTRGEQMKASFIVRKENKDLSSGDTSPWRDNRSTTSPIDQQVSRWKEIPSHHPTILSIAYYLPSEPPCIKSFNDIFNLVFFCFTSMHKSFLLI